MNKTIQQKIKEIFYPYISINSQSGTRAENQAAALVYSYFAKMPYFRDHPGQFGSYAIQGDPFDRTVEWALVKGKGRRTVVLIHHFDVVEIDDYGLMKPLAFKPGELEQALKENADALPQGAREDLLSGGYIFGRGTADMKAGGAIQMALLDEISQEENLEGNVLLLAVPDEENLSAGARSAVILMSELKTRFDLDYAIMIDAEPQLRINENTSIVTGGSVGKMLPFVYVRGVLAHAGMSQQGLNPLSILSEVIRRTEMSLELTEIQMAAGEIAPPPTWLMARDSKTIYDVSMPLSAFGCLNILLLSNRPEAVLRTLHELCQAAAADVTAQVNRAVETFLWARRLTRPRTWKTAVARFDEWIEQLKDAHGDKFELLYQQTLERAAAALERGEHSVASATWEIVDSLAQLCDANQPLVVLGLVPPFYPSVSYLDRPEFKATVQHITEVVNSMAQSKWAESYQLTPYMPGVSDMSYSSVNEAEKVENAVSRNMALYGNYYRVPFKHLSDISMPCINIGPWGKDVHKLTERVCKEDLFERTPELLLAAIWEALKE